MGALLIFKPYINCWSVRV